MLMKLSTCTLIYNISLQESKFKMRDKEFKSFLESVQNLKSKKRKLDDSLEEAQEANCKSLKSSKLDRSLDKMQKSLSDSKLYPLAMLMFAPKIVDVIPVIVGTQTIYLILFCLRVKVLEQVWTSLSQSTMSMVKILTGNSSQISQYTKFKDLLYLIDFFPPGAEHVL